jgi:hypothetical protein
MVGYSQVEPEAAELLATLVEAFRAMPREGREQFLALSGGYGPVGRVTLQHPGLVGGHLDVYQGDVESLARAGLVSSRQLSGSTRTLDVTQRGFDSYAQLKRRAGQPIQQVEQEVRSYLDGHRFARHYPAAHQKWSEAAEMLWSSDTQGQLTMVGHLCREAVQDFATALFDRFQPPNAPPDTTKDVSRIDAVLMLQ